VTGTIPKGYKGIGMEGAVARWYEKTTRKDLDEFRALASRLRAELRAGADVLEVAPGPGFLSVELARGGHCRVTGLDISKTFVEIAQKNAAAAGVAADFRQGNASQMQFSANSFDLVVCRAAFKNFSEPENALREMHRVLRPGGRALIIDLRRDVPMSEIRRYLDHLGLGWWSRWLTLWTFRFMLLKRAYTKPEMQKLLRAAAIPQAEVQGTGIGMEVRFAK
jgi:ubiquinone/menaquinone biosynthesis C-methylase UbiE